MDKTNIRKFFDNVLESSKASQDLLDKINGDLFCGDDGFWIYWPEDLRGYLNEYHLVLIAALLNKKNREWEDTIDNDPSIGRRDDNPQQGASL